MSARQAFSGIESFEHSRTATSGEGIYRLRVIDFRNKLDEAAEAIPAALVKWKESQPVVMAQSCARQLWFWMDDGVTDFPVTEGQQQGVSLLRGADAYHHLLKVIIGGDSRLLGETNIAGQFNDAWGRFCEQNPKEKPRYAGIVDHLIYDARLIRANFIDNKILSKNVSVVAKSIVDVQAGDHAVVVGDLNAHGILAKSTEQMVVALASKARKSAGTITVIHPDEACGVVIFSALQQLQVSGKLPPQNDAGRPGLNLQFGKFTEFAQLAEKADFVFIGTMMNSNSAADAQIIDVWKNRARNDNQIIHFRGDPVGHRGGSTPEWEEAELQNYTPVEKIWQKASEVERNNNYYNQLGRAAVDYCTKCRMMNARPSEPFMKRLGEMSIEERDAAFIDAAFAGTLQIKPGPEPVRS